ncbi:hypothetical protein B0H14DRAFT_3868857 [Mycena olivaceomarginata]|nr:hypothetical protein B0H14DRAFT_3868857 [Mycena olivaceomarginata]
MQTLTFYGSQTGSPPGYHPTRRRPRRSLRLAARAVFSSSSSTPTLLLALRAPPLRAPGPPITHPLRRASISRTSVPAAAGASTLALATPMPTIVEPFRTGKPPLLPRRRTSTSSAPPAADTLRAPSAYTGASSPLASLFVPASWSSSDGYRASWTRERESTSSDSPARSSNGRAPTPQLPRALRRTLLGAGGASKGEELASGGGSRGGWVNEGKRGAGAGAKASEDTEVGDVPVLSRAASDLDPASSRPWASRRAAVVCAARQWDVPALALLAAAPFLGPPQAHTRTSLSARGSASASASASAPPYKTSHDASSSACARICLPSDASHRVCGGLRVDERWTCVRGTTPVRPHPPQRCRTGCSPPAGRVCLASSLPLPAALTRHRQLHTRTPGATRAHHTCTNWSMRDAPHGAGVSCVPHAYVAARERSIVHAAAHPCPDFLSPDNKPRLHLRPLWCARCAHAVPADVPALRFSSDACRRRMMRISRTRMLPGCI